MRKTSEFKTLIRLAVILAVPIIFLATSAGSQFAQNSGGEKREYEIQTISFTKTGNADPDSLNEFQRLLGDGYQIKDLFYSGGLNVIFEK